MDNDGYLNPLEFENLARNIIEMNNPKRTITNQELAILFKTIDVDKDGMISKQELIDVTFKFNISS
jgi:Ca2+-binding EF-hand superfamily protein